MESQILSQIFHSVTFSRKPFPGSINMFAFFAHTHTHTRTPTRTQFFALAENFAPNQTENCVHKSFATISEKYDLFR